KEELVLGQERRRAREREEEEESLRIVELRYES
ncbi:hypothetical protein A2U01_0113851, partial [Trifolium medium]|nr:hypothetical protein [Trifolium medium]